MMNPGAIFDAMEPGQQDMSRSEFIRQVTELVDPARFKRDLGKTINKKQEMRTRSLLAVARKKKIDEAVGE